jgi:hypothetical protein
MAEPPPSPMPTTGGGGLGGRLRSLPPAAKYGGIALIGAVAFILWRKHKAASSAATTGATLPVSSAIDPQTGYPYASEMGTGGGGLSPSLLGYKPTGQTIGYDSNGNPIYGVNPPGTTTNGGTTTTTPTPTGNPGTPVPPQGPPPPATNPGTPTQGGGSNPATSGPPLPTPSLPPAPVQSAIGIPIFQASGNYVPGSPTFTPSVGYSPSGAPAPTKGSSGQTIGTYTWVSPGGPGMDPAGTHEFTGYPPPPGV